MSSTGEMLLKKWWELKRDIRKMEKEEEAIREKIKNVMTTKGITQIRGGEYRVTYREMSRDTLSKKDCPKEIWGKYSKSIAYPILKIDFLGEEEN